MKDPDSNDILAQTEARRIEAREKKQPPHAQRVRAAVAKAKFTAPTLPYPFIPVLLTTKEIKPIAQKSYKITCTIDKMRQMA